MKIQNYISRTTAWLSANFIVFCLVCSSVPAFSQDGGYNLRMLQESVDCSTRKVTFVAQIQASGPDSTFILGTSNIVFTISPSVLTNPVLVADNYSSGNYSALTLTDQGSIIALNVTYTGSAPFDDTVNVTTAWTDIAHLTFDIPSASDGCYSVTWNGPNSFPSGVVTQVEISGNTSAENPAFAGTLINATGCAFANNLPTASILGDTTINAGEQATLQVSFDGPPPTSISVAGVVYSNLSVSPLNINVFPDQTTTYTIDSVSNACGKGTVSGSATVTIAAVPPADTIATLDVASDTLCLGSEIQVAFTTNNSSFGSGNEFKVQLSDANGANFTDISSTSTATPGPLSATIPANLPGGAGYRLRVVSTGPGIVGTPSAPFVVADAPTATISGNATIANGNSANLTVNFTGRGPWKIQLSDGSEFTTSANPLIIPVSPTQTTTYSISTLEDACIEGTTSGTATITVQPDGEPCKTLCVPVTVAVIKM